MSEITGNIKIDFNRKSDKPSIKKTKRKSILSDIKAKKFKKKRTEIPVRIGSLMGLEQVGQCIFIEYKNDIIVIDAGMEFSADETLGVDYIIPDISYLKKNKKKIRGIIITHGHLDHIGALRDILPELDFPTVHATPLALGLIKKSFEDPVHLKAMKYEAITSVNDILTLGCFIIEFINVNHNIPETLALSIQTPKGIIFNSADFKIDFTPAIDEPANLSKIARIGAEGVKLYIGDSLGAERKGWGVSEKRIGENIDSIIRDTNSRLVISTFASNVGRIIQIIKSAIKYNKIVFLSGRSMINNVEICKELGYIDVSNGTVRKLHNEIESMPDERVVILCTGAQGEEFSALARIARGEHQHLELRRGDSVLMSASTIPGNETSVLKMFNELVTKDINLITNKDMDIHASGHGYEEDHKLMLGLVKAEYFMPFYTDASMRYAHKRIALDMGMEDEKILMPKNNGSIIELYNEDVIISDEKIKLDKVLIDGKGRGNVTGEYVLKARRIMADSGLLTLIFKTDSKTKELVGNIQIESRGFVYSSEVQKIHTGIVNFAKKRYVNLTKNNKNIREVMKIIKNDLGNYLLKEIGREPMIIPMFVYINKDGTIDKVYNEKDDIIGMTLEEQGGV